MTARLSGKEKLKLIEMEMDLLRLNKGRNTEIKGTLGVDCD